MSLRELFQYSHRHSTHSKELFTLFQCFFLLAELKLEYTVGVLLSLQILKGWYIALKRVYKRAISSNLYSECCWQGDLSV